MNNEPEITTHLYGIKTWKLNGQLHREDGPAVGCSDGFKAWFVQGKRHRVNGPAIILEDRVKKWFINDKEYSYEEWFQQLTPEQQYNYLWNLDNEQI